MANAHTVLEIKRDDLNTSAWVGDTFQVEKGALVPFSCINTMSPIKEQKCLTKSITIPTIPMKNGEWVILVAEVAIAYQKKI